MDSGNKDKTTGKLKEFEGKVTGDRDRQQQGKNEQTKGKVKDKAGDLKDKVTGD